MPLILTQTNNAITFNVACSGHTAAMQTAGRELIEGGPAGSGAVQIDPDNSLEVAVIAFATTGGIGANTWAAGDYVVRLNVSGSNGTSDWSETHICERTAGGAFNTVASLTGQTTTISVPGLFTHTVNRGTDFTPVGTDSDLYIVLVFNNLDSHGNTSTSFVPNQDIDTPIVLNGEETEPFVTQGVRSDLNVSPDSGAVSAGAVVVGARSELSLSEDTGTVASGQSLEGVKTGLSLSSASGVVVAGESEPFVTQGDRADLSLSSAAGGVDSGVSGTNVAILRLQKGLATHNEFAPDDLAQFGSDSNSPVLWRKLVDAWPLMTMAPSIRGLRDRSEVTPVGTPVFGHGLRGRHLIVNGQNSRTLNVARTLEHSIHAPGRSGALQMLCYLTANVSSAWLMGIGGEYGLTVRSGPFFRFDMFGANSGSAPTVPLNEWLSVVVNHTAGQGGVIYLNGEVYNTYSTSNTSDPSAVDLRLGNRGTAAGGSTEPLHGNIAFAALWGERLSEQNARYISARPFDWVQKRALMVPVEFTATEPKPLIISGRNRFIISVDATVPFVTDSERSDLTLSSSPGVTGHGIALDAARRGMSLEPVAGDTSAGASVSGSRESLTLSVDDGGTQAGVALDAIRASMSVVSSAGSLRSGHGLSSERNDLSLSSAPGESKAGFADSGARIALQLSPMPGGVERGQVLDGIPMALELSARSGVVVTGDSVPVSLVGDRAMLALSTNPGGIGLGASLVAVRNSLSLSSTMGAVGLGLSLGSIRRGLGIDAAEGIVQAGSSIAGQRRSMAIQAVAGAAAKGQSIGGVSTALELSARNGVVVTADSVPVLLVGDRASLLIDSTPGSVTRGSAIDGPGLDIGLTTANGDKVVGNVLDGDRVQFSLVSPSGAVVTADSIPIVIEGTRTELGISTDTADISVGMLLDGAEVLLSTESHDSQTVRGNVLGGSVALMELLERTGFVFTGVVLAKPLGDTSAVNISPRYNVVDLTPKC